MLVCICEVATNRTPKNAKFEPSLLETSKCLLTYEPKQSCKAKTCESVSMVCPQKGGIATNWRMCGDFYSKAKCNLQVRKVNQKFYIATKEQTILLFSPACFIQAVFQFRFLVLDTKPFVFSSYASSTLWYQPGGGCLQVTMFNMPLLPLLTLWSSCQCERLLLSLKASSYQHGSHVQAAPVSVSSLCVLLPPSGQHCTQQSYISHSIKFLSYDFLVHLTAPEGPIKALLKTVLMDDFVFFQIIHFACKNQIFFCIPSLCFPLVISF